MSFHSGPDSFVDGDRARVIAFSQSKNVFGCAAIVVVVPGDGVKMRANAIIVIVVVVFILLGDATIITAAAAPGQGQGDATMGVFDGNVIDLLRDNTALAVDTNSIQSDSCQFNSCQ